ncbi:MAG: GxGYxYP domain-containing protein [Candidatus Helarchaeota archaeon]
MRKSRLFSLIAFSSVIIIIGFVPLWIPPYIFNYTHINWNGADLSDGIMGDPTCFNIFSNFTQPTHLNVYDVRGLPYEQQLALTTLQGLINKQHPSLYLIFRDSDQFWLDRLHDYYGVNYTVLNNETYWQIILRYNSSIQGVIIYDEQFLDTVNVATFLAGLNGCVVIHYQMLNNFTSQLGLQPFYDFRGNFTSRVSLYSWAWKKYWPFANHKMIASRPPEKVYFRDYIVACKIFTIWLHPGPFGDINQIQLFRQIMAETPPNIPVWGWFNDPGGAIGEYEAVKTLSRSGKYSLCAAVPDLTVLSAFKDTTLTQKSVDLNISAIPLENKVYATVIVSDGDNVNMDMDYLLDLWQNPDRGTVPLGFTLEPLMTKLCPVVLRYYYENATPNEYFLAGPSGAGYTYPDLNPYFPDFLNSTKYAMDQCDMRQVWLLNGYESYQPYYSEEVLKAYTSPQLNLTGIFLDYHDFQAETNYVINDVPIFHSIWVERENEILGKLNSIANFASNSPIFVFIAYNSWDFSITKIKNVIDALPNTTFTFLRPDHFSELFKRYQEELRTSSLLNESTILLICIGSFIISLFALGVVWLGVKNSTTNDEKDLQSSTFRTIVKIFYFCLDLSFLLAIYYCFYSTILSVFYLLYFIISIYLGINLKSFLEKRIGVRATTIFAISFASLGFLLFSFSPQLIIIFGFPTGILLSRQIQSSHLLYNSLKVGKRSFLYSILFAAIIILLIPFQYYTDLIWVTALSFIGISSILCFSFKKAHLNYFQDFPTKIRFWYPKGVAFGILFFFLLTPCFIPERYYFHLLWGLENFPTKNTLALAVATIYLATILLFELLHLKNVSISKKYALILLTFGFTSYLFLPFIVQNIFCFILSISLYIFGLISILDAFILSSLPFPTQQASFTKMPYLGRDPRNFLSQTFFWIIIGLFLFFIPPSIIIVDSQAVFSFIGLTGINQLSWSPIFWSICYTPPAYIFLCIPLTIYVLLFGIIQTIHAYFF